MVFTNTAPSCMHYSLQLYSDTLHTTDPGLFQPLSGHSDPLLHPTCTGALRPFAPHLARCTVATTWQSQPTRIFLVGKASSCNTHFPTLSKLEALLTCFRMALGYKGYLHWSDFCQLSFGPFTLTPLHMCICITAAEK
jgi:hypothetical protein